MKLWQSNLFPEVSSIPLNLMFILSLSITIMFSSVTTAETQMLVFANSQHFPNRLIVNDSVMGGISRSSYQVSGSTLTYKGKVSLENNGGFASVRFYNGVRLPADKTISLRVKGDGKRYQLRFKMGRQRWSYTKTFDTQKDMWSIVQFKESDFVPTYRGMELRSVGPLQLENVTQVSVLIADKQEGPFEIELDNILFDSYGSI